MTPSRNPNQQSSSAHSTPPMHPLLAFDFRPVPPSDRQHPKRTQYLSTRLYIDNWQEHREAYEFLQRQKEFHGDSTKTHVRALLALRDIVEGSPAQPVPAPKAISSRAPASRATGTTRLQPSNDAENVARGPRARARDALASAIEQVGREAHRLSKYVRSPGA